RGVVRIAWTHRTDIHHRRARVAWLVGGLPFLVELSWRAPKGEDESPGKYRQPWPTCDSHPDLSFGLHLPGGMQGPYQDDDGPNHRGCRQNAVRIRERAAGGWQLVEPLWLHEEHVGLQRGGSHLIIC